MPLPVPAPSQLELRFYNPENNFREELVEEEEEEENARVNGEKEAKGRFY